MARNSTLSPYSVNRWMPLLMWGAWMAQLGCVAITEEEGPDELGMDEAARGGKKRDGGNGNGNGTGSSGTTASSMDPPSSMSPPSSMDPPSSSAAGTATSMAAPSSSVAAATSRASSSSTAPISSSSAAVIPSSSSAALASSAARSSSSATPSSSTISTSGPRVVVSAQALSPTSARVFFGGTDPAAGDPKHAHWLRFSTGNGLGCGALRSGASADYLGFVPGGTFAAWIEYDDGTSSPHVSFTTPQAAPETVPPAVGNLAHFQYWDSGVQYDYLSGGASDLTGLKKVEFFINDALVYTFDVMVPGYTLYQQGWVREVTADANGLSYIYGGNHAVTWQGYAVYKMVATDVFDNTSVITLQDTPPTIIPPSSSGPLYVASISMVTPTVAKLNIGGVDPASGDLKAASLTFNKLTDGGSCSMGGCTMPKQAGDAFYEGLTPGHSYEVWYNYAGGARSPSIRLDVPSVSSETHAPTVQEISYSEVTVSGQPNVYINVRAGDDSGLSKVEFFINGALVNTYDVRPSGGGEWFRPVYFQSGLSYYSNYGTPVTWSGTPQVRVVATDLFGNQTVLNY